jgi:diaminopimelate epimerase
MRFTKLQGAGNDYIYVNGLEDERDWPGVSRRVADRHFGVGADGLIVVKPSDRADVGMRMYNVDGSEGLMCGNGIRCFTKFVLEGDLIKGKHDSIDVETASGVFTIVPEWQGDRIVGACVDMHAPILRATDVPIDATWVGASDYSKLDAGLVETLHLRPGDLVFNAPITVDGTTFVGTAVGMGNPHFSVFTDIPVGDVPLDKLGPLVEHHEAFPARVNLTIANIESRTHVTTRTWERGSGLTLACGTGVSAVVVAARLQGLVDDTVTVKVPGGELTITWSGQGSVFLEGDAVEVFSGDFPD